LLPPRLDRFLRRVRGDESITPTDEVAAAGPDERLADLEVVLGLEELHQRALQLAVAEVLRGVHRLVRERVDAGVVHARRDVERHDALHEVVQHRPVRKSFTHHSRNPSNAYVT
jgi:hypothetical protein